MLTPLFNLDNVIEEALLPDTKAALFAPTLRSQTQDAGAENPALGMAWFPFLMAAYQAFNGGSNSPVQVKLTQLAKAGTITQAQKVAAGAITPNGYAQRWADLMVVQNA